MNKKSRYDWKSLQKDYDNGLTLIELHQKYGVATSSIKKAAKRGDFKLRSLSESMKLSFKLKGSRFGSSEDLSRYRKYQLDVEQSLSQDLIDEGYEVFSPTAVCDRIAIKDEKVYFIEFKPEGQGLRYSQNKVSQHTSDEYKVVFYNKEKYRKKYLKHK